MMETLNNFLMKLQFGPHEKKVAEYLEDATPESVQKDLLHALAQSRSGKQDSWAAFDAFCVEEGNPQRYWTKDTLKKHTQKTHPHVVFSENEIDMLWRCFHFYAHHPFPREATEYSTIDGNGFQRAVTLLVYQATDLLGTQDGGDIYWREPALLRNADFARMLRSIGHPGEKRTQTPESGVSTEDSRSVLSDTMDVLAMTQPFSISLAPSPDQLQPVAQKLLDIESTPMRYQVTRETLSTLLGLLFRMRLDYTRPCRGKNYGAFEQSSAENEELANSIANEIVGERGYLTPDDAVWVQDLLPNLRERFHQLWAAIFKPPIGQPFPHDNERVLPLHILAAISLFVPISTVQTASQNSSSTSEPDQEGNAMAAKSLIKTLHNPHNSINMSINGDPRTRIAALISGRMREGQTGG